MTKLDRGFRCSIVLDREGEVRYGQKAGKIGVLSN